MEGHRGVSAVVGIILITGLTLATVTAILAVGSVVLVDAQADATTSQMENSMSQMASKASLVALGESEGQEFDLGNLGDGAVTVVPDAGTITVTYEPEDEDYDSLEYSESLGAVIYSNGNEQVAFQGGGVWKKHPSGSSMLSPPEYHYQHQTLTFPLIRVADGSGSAASGQGFITQIDSTRIFPEDGKNHENPVREGNVTVEIVSEYHDGWAAFFEARTEGGVDHYPEEDRVKVDLTVPFETEYSSPVAATTNSPGIERQGGGHDDHYDDWEEGVAYPPVSGKIDQLVDDCTEWDEAESDQTFSDEKYCIDSVDEVNTWTFEDSDDITLIIDDRLDVGNGEIIVDEGTDVTVYVTNGFELRGSGKVNVKGDTTASQFQVYVHGEAEETAVDLSGGPEMRGLIYAPESRVELGGNPDYQGAIIGEEIVDAGSPATDVEFDESLEDLDIDFGEINIVRYLHISENQVSIDLS